VHFRTLFIWDIALRHHVHCPTFQNPHLRGSMVHFRIHMQDFKRTVFRDLHELPAPPQQNIQNSMVLLTVLCLRDGKVSSTRGITILEVIVKPCSVCSTLATQGSDIKSIMWWFMISVNISNAVGWTLRHLHLLSQKTKITNWLYSHFFKIMIVICVCYLTALSIAKIIQHHDRWTKKCENLLEW
jgi:hypothetical protein